MLNTLAGIIASSGGTSLSTFVDYLVLAGGGGGGGTNGGGGVIGGAGGAGGYRYFTNQTLTIGSYSITIGAGGAGNTTSGSNGSNSSLGSISATGGGGGGVGSNSTPGGNGLSGGSGGGAGGSGATPYPTGGAGNAGSYSPVEGYAGQNGFAGGSAGGGGGASGTTQSNTVGMPGVSNSISGSAVIYGDGGWGNGRAGAGVIPPTPTANRGIGGDGGFNVSGGNGSSGVVIVRYLTGAITATGGTVTTSGSYTIHTFTSNGTFQRTA